MKKLLGLALGLLLIGALGTNVGATPVPVNALPGFSTVLPDPFLLTFDENGHATVSVNGGAATPLTGTLQTDPANSQPGQPLALTYLLPEPVVSGDVKIIEAGTTGSDWLRFTDNAGHIDGTATGAGARMLFYSEFEIGETNADLADTGFPANLGTGRTTTIAEVGTEGSNGFDYQPGGVPAPANNEYKGTSDAVVPEPATVLLMASGLLGLAGWRRYSSRG